MACPLLLVSLSFIFTVNLILHCRKILISSFGHHYYLVLTSFILELLNVQDTFLIWTCSTLTYVLITAVQILSNTKYLLILLIQNGGDATSKNNLKNKKKFFKFPTRLLLVKIN